MKHKFNKYLPCLIIIATIWLALSAFCWLKPANMDSETERRKLTQFPELSVKTLISGEFMNSFEKYTLDQFPFRDKLRTLKSINTYYIFSQKDNNNIYISNGYAAKLEYPLNENSVTSATEKFNKLYETYMKDKDVKAYISVVPDKGYFLAKENGYPSLDYEKLFSLIKENVDFAEYISIDDCLKITDYYRTDTHWRQEKIFPVAKRIAEAMGVGDKISDDFSVITAENPFYGVYYGQSALPLGSEKISYLTSDILENCEVYNLETDKVGKIYEMDKLNGRDPYEVYLSGSTPLLIINNKNCEEKRELVVFRDSFASSLIPLLVGAYSKITVIDIRYISPELIGNYLTFDSQDVLFLYSSLILNSSEVLK